MIKRVKYPDVSHWGKSSQFPQHKDNTETVSLESEFHDTLQVNSSSSDMELF